MQATVLNGARCTVSINGSLVAAGFVADYTLQTNAVEIETIDSVFPAEIAPDRIRVRMNLRVYRTASNDPVLSKYIAGGATVGQAEQNAFTQANYIFIEIKDDNDQTVLYVPKAWITSRSGTLSMQDLLSENWSIIGIGFFGPQN